MLSLNTSHKKANMSCNLQGGQFKIKLAEDLFPHKPVSFDTESAGIQPFLLLLSKYSKKQVFSNLISARAMIAIQSSSLSSNQ